MRKDSLIKFKALFHETCRTLMKLHPITYLNICVDESFPVPNTIDAKSTILILEWEVGGEWNWWHWQMSKMKVTGSEEVHVWTPHRTEFAARSLNVLRCHSLIKVEVSKWWLVEAIQRTQSGPKHRRPTLATTKRELFVWR